MVETFLKLKIFHFSLVPQLKLIRSGHPSTLPHLLHYMMQIVIKSVVKYVGTIYLETYELDQNWNDHAVAFVCWDVIMNQWLKVFLL